MSTSLVIWNLNITEPYPEIQLKVSLKEETKIDGRGHEIFSEKITGPWNIWVYGLLNYKIFFERFVKPSGAPSYIRSLILPGYISKHLTAFYFNISILIFWTLFICFVFDGLLWLIHFRMFCSKHSIAFENTCLLSCWFRCVDIFCIKFRSCDTLTVREVFISGLAFLRFTFHWYLYCDK